VVKFHTILTSLAGVLPLYLKINVIYRICHLSGYILPQFLSEEPLILLNVAMDIEDVHVPNILIFFNIRENYRLLNLVGF
jgi:hypothetical protein